MNKNIQTQTIKPIKKMQNPFEKYKDVEVTRKDSSVDYNFRNFKEKTMAGSMSRNIAKFTTAASISCIPLVGASVYTGSSSSVILAVSSLFLAGVATKSFNDESKLSKEISEKEKVYMSEYSEEEKTYLFKRMYNEFEKHLENGKKLFDKIVRASVVTAGSIGIAVLTQMDSLRTFAIGIAVGSVLYAMGKISEHYGEKKAIKEIENMM